jgi:predicted negative regulator of RcsB-dependent stress response
MKIHHTDQDQIAMLKDWWRNYGKALSIAVVLGILLGYGVRFWRVHRATLLENASIQYQTLIETQANNPSNIKPLQTITENLKEHYIHTPYAALASLLFAKSYVTENKYNEALNELDWIINHSHDKTIKQIARLRSARILLAQGKVDQAALTLNVVNDPTYEPYINLLKGYIYQTQQNLEKAQASFSLAEKQLAQKQVLYEPLPLIQSTPLTTS